MKSSNGLPDVDPKRLRRMFGAFASGVTVVTTAGAVMHAMTANSFTSVSLDPPLLLVCVGREAVMHQRLAASGRFGVSVLAADQEELARHFADRTRTLGAAQFEPVAWTAGPVTGVPLIDGALARFECELLCAYEGGDHTIFVGSVLYLDGPTGESEDGLVFFRGRFRQISAEASEVTA